MMYDNQMNQISQASNQQKEAQLIQRANQQIENFESGSSRNRRNATIGKAIIIILSWIATVLVIGLITTVGEQVYLPWWKIMLSLKLVAFVSSAISTLATTLIPVGIFEEKWKGDYRDAETVKRELNDFQLGFRRYKGKNAEERLELFNETIGDIAESNAANRKNPTTRYQRKARFSFFNRK